MTAPQWQLAKRSLGRKRNRDRTSDVEFNVQLMVVVEVVYGGWVLWGTPLNSRGHFSYGENRQAPGSEDEATGVSRVFMLSLAWDLPSRATDDASVCLSYANLCTNTLPAPCWKNAQIQIIAASVQMQMPSDAKESLVQEQLNLNPCKIRPRKHQAKEVRRP